MSSVSVAGGRARNQNFTLDGGNVSNAVGLTRPQQLTSLPVDAMQEFKVISSSYSAEYGHSTGGIVTMQVQEAPDNNGAPGAWNQVNDPDLGLLSLVAFVAYST